MSDTLPQVLRRLLSDGTPVAYAEIAEARGSTPREAGAAMLVTATAIDGTIGGGRMEFDVIARARGLLAAGEAAATLDISLGPAIGQCCGGRVRIAITRATGTLLARLDSDRAARAAAQPVVLLFGAGHVGQALARALAPLPLRVRWIDGRADEFGPAIPGVCALMSGDWETPLAQAPPGAACVVLTHSHALDSLIVATALERDDFSYVGLIGSVTKRRQFERAFRTIGMSESRIARLVCPIGAALRDKRPAVIAAFAAAEVLRAVLAWPAEIQASREKPLALSAAR